MDSDEQALLWSNFLKGNRQAFQKIYALYYKNLYEYGMRKAKDEDVVRDCIHDMFVKLWLNKNNLSQAQNSKIYLLGALRNHLSNYNTASDKIKYIDIAEAESFTLDFNAETELIKKEQIEYKAKILLQAINQLTGRQKEVLYLHYFEELSNADIAELMNITVKGVYKLQYRAISALKTILEFPKNDIIALLMVLKLLY